MHPVIQQHPTGCGIAASALLAGVGYAEAKAVASALGIDASDPALWSDPNSVRRLLRQLGVALAPDQTPFDSWEHLPDKALLAIKWRMEGDRPFWHWVVFVRDGDGARVLDSKASLKSNVRRDFGRIKPKWFIEVCG
ncbi:hypothetical protein [Motiliproteus sediminis]|uniref:hypothetical protein n=1 Tax=Motiliproteus sediminis TaxID=1468178 RepID=UPI001AEF3D59|nr:hypothetical protein [Motiliproteus sediminis]